MSRGESHLEAGRASPLLVLALLVAAAAALTGVALSFRGSSGGARSAGAGGSSGEPKMPAVRVVGNHLVGASGKQLRLLGVDRSGTETACIQGRSILGGPSDLASVDAMKSWHIDAVRLPLNEDCWLGLNGVPPRFGGRAYRHAIEGYVHLLNVEGLVVILDLHWSAPGREPSTGQQLMADESHSVAFWHSVGLAFERDRGVIFDLYNEPETISWSCWLSGCTTSQGWRAAGMQQMLDAIRSAGATQPVMLGGIRWASDVSGWLAHEPHDPLHQLVASVHIYNFSGCNTEACWNATIAPLAKKVPVVTGEMGENDCRSGFVDSYMSWADAHGVSYLAWAWNVQSCTAFPALITSYTGAPTPFGAGVRAHLAYLATRRPASAR